MSVPKSWEDPHAEAVFRALPTPAPLTNEQVERIEHRLRARLSQERRLPRWLKLVLGTGAFLGAPLAFAALYELVALHQPGGAVEETAKVVIEEAASPPSISPTLDFEAMDLTMPAAAAETPTRPPVRVAKGTPARRAEKPPPAQNTSAGDDGSLTTEAALLGKAISQLLEHDAQGALATLDLHRQRFPGGQLTDEARLRRLQALIALRRPTDALAELEPLSGADFERMPRGAETRALHGELLLQAGRARDAERVFDELLAGPRSLVVEERALFGRASARARRDDVPGAQADLRRYRERFPRGRFAAEAERLLSAD
ncbi:MAG: tetratricopeptide repeat protein [Myxococcota bacterium]